MFALGCGAGDAIPTKGSGAPEGKRNGNYRQGARTKAIVVDVIEEPAPGVMTVTEIEETQISAGRDDREE